MPSQPSRPGLYDHSDDCPTCGAELQVFRSTKDSYSVVCSSCELATMFYPTERMATKAWNEGETLTAQERLASN